MHFFHCLPFFYVTCLLSLQISCTPSAPLLSFAPTGHLFPSDGAQLTQTVILLEFEAVPNATQYEIQLSPKACKDFETCAIRTLTTTSLAVTIEEALDFGQSYQWRVKAFRNQKLLHISKTCQFDILYNQKIDTALFRHRVVQHTNEQLPKGYVCVDDIGVIVDYTGQAVYCIPSPGGRHGFECMELLPNGNIAYLTGNLLEITLQNDTVFNQVPPFKYGKDGTTCTAFHHSFTTTSSGNYLVLGSKLLDKQYKKGTYILETDTSYVRDSVFRISHSMVLELDKKTGQVNWFYDWGDYIADLDEQYEGTFVTNGHANAVHFNEQENTVLVSLRDLHRVIKIDRATKKVVDSYGFDDNVGAVTKNSDAFKRQHSAELDSNGNLLVYNNGTGKGADTISSIVVLQIPENKGAALNKLWEFPCNFGNKTQSWSKAKGDVDELDDSHYIVSMGVIPRTFIVNKNKEVLWECIHETFKQTVYNKINKRQVHLAKNAVDGAWKPFVCNYSASFTPSLFPNYFTCQLIAKGDKTFLKINNEGGISNPINWQVFYGEKPLTEISGQQKIAANQHHLQEINTSKTGIYSVLLSSDFQKEVTKEYQFEILLQPSID